MPFIPKPKPKPWIVKYKPFETMDHSNQWFYDSLEWKRIRKSKLTRNPLCELCLKDGRITSATMVDHIKSINKNGSKRAYSNLMSLCEKCHARKSREDGRNKVHDDEG